MWEPPQLACRPGECRAPLDSPSPLSICLWGFPFTWGFLCPPQAWLSPPTTERVPGAEATTSPGPGAGADGDGTGTPARIPAWHNTLLLGVCPLVCFISVQRNPNN